MLLFARIAEYYVEVTWQFSTLEQSNHISVCIEAYIWICFSNLYPLSKILWRVKVTAVVYANVVDFTLAHDFFIHKINKVVTAC